MMKTKEIDVTKLSEKNKEPKWLLEQRLTSLQESKDLPLPKLERTRITNWGFEDFHLDQDKVVHTELNRLPEDIHSFLTHEGQFSYHCAEKYASGCCQESRN